MEVTKSTLRARAKRNRRAMQIDHARLCTVVDRFLAQRSGWVVAYSALPGEPNLGPLLADAASARFALTRTPDTGMDLTVHPASGVLERHRYGFDQPVAESEVVADEEIAVVLVPGLAFDRHGNRLGHGAGYYDRFLARLGPDVAIVGVSDGFIVDRIPSEPHDVAMTHLATDAGVMALPLVARPR